MLSKAIGKNIKQFRTKKGLSQDDLAAQLFVTRQTVSNYETGRSFPDIDMLQNIAIALDVELVWLLYGKPTALEKANDRKVTLRLAIIFCAVAIFIFFLYTYTDYLKISKQIPMPNILVRLVFIPACMILLGYTFMQAIHYFIGVGTIKSNIQKVGRVFTLCLLCSNYVITLPYILWCLVILFQIVLDYNSISMIFPRIPVYQEVAYFILKLMYSFPFVYILFGIALWLFYPPKRG